MGGLDSLRSIRRELLSDNGTNISRHTQGNIVKYKLKFYDYEQYVVLEEKFYGKFILKGNDF
jgi:hypothetical protein